MSSNGRLADSELAAIPEGRLRRDAAAAWNAMNAESVRRFGVVLRPRGPASSYRTFAQQVFLRKDACAKGQCRNAAVPGTSNHGLGLAVDVHDQKVRWVIDQIGRPYGYAKDWSDASWEWWHILYRPGVWKGHVPPAGPATVRRGQSGPAVRRLQRRLRAHGFASVRVTGFFGIATARAVRRFQRKHHLTIDGVAGPQTWAAALKHP